MSLEKIVNNIEDLDSVVQATVEPDEPKGVILHISLTEDSEGNAEKVIDDVLALLPKDVFDASVEGERVNLHYDSITIHL